MGINTSISAKSKEESSIQGQISLATDDYSYKPGDLVKGNVFIQMFESFSTNKLKLKLKVEECTKFNNIESKVTHFQGVTTIVDFRQNLIAPGEYQYPFSFVLPRYLPGSFEYYDRENKAYVTYILEAELPAIKPQNSIKSFLLLIVSQRLEALGIQIRKESTEKLYSFCCIPQGGATLRASLPKENFYAHEFVKILCELDNRDTRLNGKDIKAKLIQNILLKDKTGRSKLIQRVISKVHFKHFYPKRDITRFSLEIPLSDSNNPTRRYVDKCDHIDLLKDKRMVSNLQASTRSELINCTYIVELMAYYDGILIKTLGPGVKVTVAVYIPDVRVKQLDRSEHQWNPKILPEKKLNFSNYPTSEQLGIPQYLVAIKG
jgi:hypothetical protein